MSRRTNQGRRLHPPIRVRVVGVLAVLAMVVASCGSGSTTSTEATDTTTTTGVQATDTTTTTGVQATDTTVGKKPGDLAQYIGHPDPALCGGREYTLGYTTFSDSEEFSVQFFKGIQRVAKELGCVTVNKLVDNMDPAKVVQNVNIFVQQGVDGVMSFNVLAAAGPGQDQVLKAADMPAVSIVVPLEGYPFVTNDDFSDGLSGGTELGKAYNATGDKGPVYGLIGRFDAQGQTGIDRLDGVVAGLKATVPDIKLLEFEATADPPTAQAAAAAVIGRIPAGAKILVSAINDGITFALLQALKAQGRAGDSLIVSMTGVNPGGLQFMCQNKEYVGAVGFFPETWADYMIPVLIAEIQGADVPAKTIVPTQFIPRDSINKFYPDFVCKG